MKQFYLLYGNFTKSDSRNEAIVYCLNPKDTEQYKTLEERLGKYLGYENVGYIPLLSIPKVVWTNRWMREVIAHIWSENGRFRYHTTLKRLQGQTRKELLEIIEKEINL